MVNIITNPVPKPKGSTVVVDWSPRICGATAWGGHLQAADRSIELLSFSKSGRPLGSWESAFSWQARKISDAAAILNDYDKVILGDIACFAPDVTLDGDGRPYYEAVMDSVHRKWTAVFHGGTYPSKHDDTIDRLLNGPGFCGTLVTPRIGQARERLAQWPALRFAHHPYLPYDVSHGPQRRDKRRRTKDVLMTARLMSNKGQNAALALADHLIGDTHIWGYNPFGFPSIAWGLWELGTMGLGYEQLEYPILRKDKLSLTHPNAHHHYTGKFALRTPRGRTYRYHDGYLRLDEVDWSPWLHLSLASSAFAGILEYTIIDAVMAGSIVVVPEAFPSEGKYDTVITIPFSGSTISWDNDRKRVRERKTFDREEVADVINSHLRLSHNRLGETADAQHQEFLRLHDPRETLKAVNKALKGANKLANVSFTRQPANMGLITPSAAPPKKSGGKQIDNDKLFKQIAYGGKAMAPEPGEKSGAFIRRCLVAGADGETILTWVHAHFEGSKAKMSDIGWNRNKLKADGWVPGAAAPTSEPRQHVERQIQQKKFDPPAKTNDAPFDGGTPVVPASLVDAFIDAFTSVALTLDKKTRDRIVKAIR